MEDAADELAALESLDNGKTYSWSHGTDVPCTMRVGPTNTVAKPLRRTKIPLRILAMSPLELLDKSFLGTSLSSCSSGRLHQLSPQGTIFVQSGVYDEFLQKFTEKAKSIKIGDPFDEGIDQGPQISKIQYDRIMGYIDSGKADGAHVHLGGGRVGEEGYFIEPTIFTNVSAEMKIVKEEIFGPVGVIIKFEDEEDIVRQANDTTYGLAAAVFSRDINQAIRTTHKLKAGTVWVNCYNTFYPSVPFGGYKQSGIGRELGEYALSNYTNVKAVQINLGNA
ncbi:aldehyde dehydrogenase [Coprinopsis cinerea AmutBmut pab1-1]|nr:aldehyde dehydrogenase [Coprinopsis cinerea AmutBmut pab1-1]